LKKSSEDYITLDEYVEYINKSSILEVNSYTKLKFKNMLKNNPLGANLIKENSVIYIKKEYIRSSIELYKNSISIVNASMRISENLGKDVNYVKNIRTLLLNNFNTYRIELFDLNIYYISKNNLNTILRASDEIKEKECIRTNELLYKVNSMFNGVKFCKTEKKIFKFIKESNLEVLDKNFIGNFSYNIENLYPKSTVDKVIDNLKEYIKEKKVKLINMSFDEYLSLSEEDFNENYMILSVDKFSEIEGYVRSSFKAVETTFKYTNVKVIWIYKCNMYVSKKEFNEFIDFKNNYVGSSYFRELNITFNNKVAKNNGINLRHYKEQYYIKKEDIENYLKVNKFNFEFSNAKSMYDRVKIKIKYFPNKNESKYPKFNEYFMEFVKYTNRNVRTFRYVALFYNIYNILLDNIKKDLEPENEKENNRLFNKAIRIVYESQNNRAALIQLVNYLRNKKSFNLGRIVDIKEKGTKEKYTKEQFVTLLSKLIEIVANKDNFKKLYRNWNLSTSVTYIFMHYCLAWRRIDLITRLPKPNLREIESVTDGESFIKWLESDNLISDKVANIICKGLEEETKRLSLKANKNNRELNCIISNTLAKEVATLLCINEANRQIHCSKGGYRIYKDRCFNEVYTQPKEMQKLLKENFDLHIEEILGGDFDNIRMNKGFLAMVKEKAEELNLAYSYYYAQVARSHTPTKGALAETTKIYLQKDISRASVMAFATGTMGSIAYTLLKLVDNDFVNISYEEQIKAIQNLNMTPYTIERNVKNISNKISVMRREIDNFIKHGGYKEDFLKELLYGQNSYGIEKRTKCLLKIIKKNEIGISRIKSQNYNEKNAINKWCPFNRKNCIGCEYMIALRYFIYEFERKFNEVLDDLECAESELDKDIAIESINQVYFPLMTDLSFFIGDEINNVIDTERYLKLVENTSR